MVWVLTQDLFYYSKLNAVAERRGVQIVRVASYSARPAGPPPGLAVLDLGLPLLDEIDPDVDVVRGSPRGGATTMAALDSSFDAVFLVGHHGAAHDETVGAPACCVGLADHQPCVVGAKCSAVRTS